MRLHTTVSSLCAAAVVLFDSPTTGAKQNVNAGEGSSTAMLSTPFAPPQVFKNINLVRNTNLDKGYVKETINVVIENTAKTPEDEYYLPFAADVIAKVGGLEAKDRKDGSKPVFKSEAVDFDTYSPTQFYRITLSPPLAPGTQLTLSISYAILSSLAPLPATLPQTEKQYLTYAFSAYVPTAYPTQNQRTKLKLPTSDIPDYAVVPSTSAAPSENTEDPVRTGSTLQYGTFKDVPVGAYEPVSVRYEFTKPLNHVKSLERDIEVSHWGGNLAFEERYDLTNVGAGIKGQFNRVQWASTAYYNPPTFALRELVLPLQGGSANPYFIDDVGNVSTSKFRSNINEARLELKPRYPIFGGWNYKFKVGWDRELKDSLRKLKNGETHVLKVPFLEGPRQKEGISYEKVKVRVILPEGARNINYETSVPILGSSHAIHHTFMDTQGRTTLTLDAMNLIDSWDDHTLIVTYDYPFTAGLRKPLTLLASVLAIFSVAYLVSKVDVSIGKR